MTAILLRGTAPVRAEKRCTDSNVLAVFSWMLKGWAEKTNIQSTDNALAFWGNKFQMPFLFAGLCREDGQGARCTPPVLTAATQDWGGRGLAETSLLFLTLTQFSHPAS